MIIPDQLQCIEFLQCGHAVRWVTERASSRLKNLFLPRETCYCGIQSVKKPVLAKGNLLLLDANSDANPGPHGKCPLT